MQQLLQEAAAAADTVEQRVVTIFVQSKLFSLKGQWQWDLLCDAVYCSDVMLNLPENFFGTKGIIHPDDISSLQKNIYYSEAIGEEETFDLQFRIITTYGEVKTLRGKKVKFHSRENDPLLKDPESALIKKTLGEATRAWENEALELRKQISEFSERIHLMGGWFFNLTAKEAFYSDNYYHIYGLPPQSLNAQLYTFAGFLHPDDKNAVVSAIDTTCRLMLPLDIEYRILRADGEIRYVHHASTIDFNNKGEHVVLGMVKDITEQKLQQNIVEELEQKLDIQVKLVEFAEGVADIGHWQVDMMTRKFIFSDQFYKIFGLKATQEPNINMIAEYVHPDDRLNFIEVHRNIISRHLPPDLEFRVIKPDGKVRHIRQKGKLVISGKTDLMIIGTVKDVTVEKLNDMRLKDLKNELFVKDFSYQKAEQLAGIASWFWEIATGKITWSSNLFQLIGIKYTNDFSLNNLLKYIHPDDREMFNHHVSNAHEYFTGTDFDLRLLTRGDTKRFKATFKAVSDDGYKCIICIIQDITFQSNLEQKLTNQLRFTELLSATIKDKILATDNNYSIIEWNKACEFTTGKSRDEVLNTNFFDVFPALKNSSVLQYLSDALNGETVSVNMPLNSYMRGHYEITFSPLRDAGGTIVGVLHLLADKSKEADLQDRLNQRLNFIENLVEASIDPLIVLDNHLNYIYWNKQSEALFGINKEYILGKNILEILPATSNNPDYTDFKKVLKGEVICLPAKNNQDRYYEVYLVPVKDEKDNVSGILWMLHDLTKEMQLLEQLQASHHLLDTTTKATPDAVTIFDLINKQPLYLNNNLADWLGYTNEELIDLGYDERLQLIYAEDRKKVLDHNAAMRLASDGEVREVEYRIVNKAGKIIWVCNRTKVFNRNEKGEVTHILSVVQDITDRKE